MRQLYTVTSEGTIDYAGGINGPLTTPTVLPTNAVVNMVRKGLEVYQHNPVNLSEKVLVTMQNVGDVKFTSTKSEAVTQRSLNKSIQDLNKPMMANVNRKSDDSNKPFDKNSKKGNNNQKEEVKKETSNEESVTTPDVFTKN